MDNKYYIPDIEDLRVGYECEKRSYAGHRTFNKVTRKYDIEAWDKYVIQAINDYGITMALDEELRTPYLTKENIESEGWEYLEQQGPNKDYLDFVKRVDTSKNRETELYKYDIYLQYNFTTKELDIYNDDELSFENYFKGACKSVNELRIIMKLLNI